MKKSGQHSDSEQTRENYEITKNMGLLLYLFDSITEIV
jgi:hypothetical protein